MVAGGSRKEQMSDRKGQLLLGTERMEAWDDQKPRCYLAKPRRGAVAPTRASEDRPGSYGGCKKQRQSHVLHRKHSAD